LNERKARESGLRLKASIAPTPSRSFEGTLCGESLSVASVKTAAIHRDCPDDFSSHFTRIRPAEKNPDCVLSASPLKQTWVSAASPQSHIYQSGYSSALVNVNTKWPMNEPTTQAMSDEVDRPDAGNAGSFSTRSKSIS
jgi:hypothetical protein